MRHLKLRNGQKLIFDAFKLLGCEWTMSQFTYFYGVKFMAWKSGGVKFWQISCLCRMNRRKHDRVQSTMLLQLERLELAKLACKYKSSDLHLAQIILVCLLQVHLQGLETEELEEGFTNNWKFSAIGLLDWCFNYGKKSGAKFENLLFIVLLYAFDRLLLFATQVWKSLLVLRLLWEKIVKGKDLD